MHHLVMAERQDEIFVKGVEQPEGDVVMMVRTVHRVPLQIAQRVVHEAHIPFEPEPQSTRIDRARNAWPAGGLFGDRHDAGMRAIERFVHLLKEGHGLDIFATAMVVGDPFPRLPRIIEVEHGGDRIHPQPIDMIALRPE